MKFFTKQDIIPYQSDTSHTFQGIEQFAICVVPPHVLPGFHRGFLSGVQNLLLSKFSMVTLIFNVPEQNSFGRRNFSRGEGPNLPYGREPVQTAKSSIQI